MLPAKQPRSSARPEDGTPDDVLLEQVRCGDKIQFAALMRRYNQRLFRVARAVVRDDAEAEDAVQQAYVSAYTQLEQLRESAKFGPWITRIAFYEALARARARARAAHRGDVALTDGGDEEASSAIAAIAAATPEDNASAREFGRF